MNFYIDQYQKRMQLYDIKVYQNLCVAWKVKVKSLSRVQLFETPWTVANQSPLSRVFSRPERWSGLPFPSPEDLPYPGIKATSPTLQADALPSKPPGKSFKLYGLPHL